MKRKRKTGPPRLLLTEILRGELTLKRFQATTSRRYFNDAVARLRCVDDPRVQDFLDEAPVRPEDALLSVQLFGDERRRYDEIKKRRDEAEKSLFATKTNVE